MTTKKVPLPVRIEAAVLSTYIARSVRTGGHVRQAAILDESLMNCPHCQASQTQELNGTTDLSYAVFRCGRCQRKFNERRAVRSIIWNFPPTLYSRLYSADYDIS